MRRIISVMALSVLGAGCTTLQPREGFEEIVQVAHERTGAQTVWNAGTEADESVAQAVAQMLDAELAVEQAVQIAMLNNPQLQADYEQLGIAQADLVEAGLLTNPVFSVLVRFPEAGAGGANVDLGISQNFVELISLPMRKKVAAAEYESTKSQVANQVIALAADVKVAFIELQAAEQIVALRQQVTDAMNASQEVARQLHEAGNISDLQLALEQASASEAQLELSQAKAEVVALRESLARLMGLPAASFRLQAQLADAPADPLEKKDIESQALANRFDLQAVRHSAMGTAEALGLAKQFAWLNDADVEFEAERETDGQWIMGPGLSVPIPIFDTGAARKAGARSAMRQALQRVRAMEIAIRSEARTALTQTEAARARAIHLRQTLIPLRQRITRETLLQYNAMNASVFDLLQAKRAEIETGQAYIESLRDYWIARAELERAVGGKIENAKETDHVTDTTPTAG